MLAGRWGGGARKIGGCAARSGFDSHPYSSQPSNALRAVYRKGKDGIRTKKQSPRCLRLHAGSGIYAGGDGRIRTADRGFADPRLNHLATSPCCYNALVPRRRLELLQPCGHSALNAACLPIPPPRPAHGLRLPAQSGRLLNRAVVADATIIANETRYVHTLRQKAFYHQRIRFSIPVNFCQSHLTFVNSRCSINIKSSTLSEWSIDMPNIRFTPPCS